MNNSPSESLSNARQKIAEVFIDTVENQKNPEGNSAKQYPEIGEAALVGQAGEAAIHNNTDTVFPDYRQKIETDPVNNSIEKILNIGESLATLRKQAANNPRL